MSYACTYGASLVKIDFIITEMRACMPLETIVAFKDHLGRNALQNLVMNRNITVKDRLDYIHNLLASLK